MRRLPGVSVVDVPAARADALPAMDVPVFVGFAERGPVDRPVRLDDATQFEAVFGRRFELLRGDDGRVVHAHLPAAVQSFFAGGGRRCHVVRVAGPGAASARWRVPGVTLLQRRAEGWQPVDGPWLVAASPGSWADRLQLAARWRLQALQPASRVAAGDLLRLRDATGSDGWLRVAADGTAADALAAGGAWWRGTPASPSAPAAIERATLDLALREPARPEIGVPARAWRRDACGAARGAGASPWTETDAAARLDADANALVDPDAWPLAGGPLPDGDWMLVAEAGEPSPFFSAWAAAETGAGDALQRNGLADFGAALFVDRRWTPDLHGATLLAWADHERYRADAPRRLGGLHAALGRDGDAVRESTWIAVPDAVHVGWEPLPAPETFEATLSLAPPTAAPRDPAAFADCAPRRCPPAAPVWDWPGTPVEVAADTAWQLLLRDPASPPQATARLQIEIASDADFADARPLPASGGETLHAAPAVLALRLPQGLHLLRARSVDAGLASPWTAPVQLFARAASRRLRPAPAADDDSVVATVHGALLDLAAATREHSALLSVPADWREAELARHVDALRRLAARDERAQAASFAVLHHPWLLQALPAAGTAPVEAHPPEGALLAQYARRSRERGAWSAAGLEPLVWAVGVHGGARDTPPPPQAVEAAGANAIETRVRGVAATRAWTLDPEPDWQALGVRRLFILLRRIAQREGERFAFEPNDGALRRSLVHAFDRWLARLMQRGALQGTRAAEAYALGVASGAALAREIDDGRCSLEIRVAPSRPLRFLKLVVVRAGEQWQFAEEG